MGLKGNVVATTNTGRRKINYQSQGKFDSEGQPMFRQDSHEGKMPSAVVQEPEQERSFGEAWKDPEYLHRAFHIQSSTRP